MKYSNNLKLQKLQLNLLSLQYNKADNDIKVTKKVDSFLKDLIAFLDGAKFIKILFNIKTIVALLRQFLKMFR